MLVYILRFIFGTLRIEIKGDYPERFFNVCAANEIKLWGYGKSGNTLVASIAASDYLKVMPLRRKSGVSLRILKKTGLPFVIRPYKGRVGIIAGVAVFFLVQAVLSMFVWNIKVNGNSSVKTDEILAVCKSIGVYEGALSNNIDTNDARLKLLLKDGRLSWASFIIEGSKVTVNVLEEKKAQPKPRDPANFVALRDGVIEKVTVSSGKATVQKGQAVLKGELLATGAIEYTDGTTVFTRCAGEVFAKTERTLKASVPKTKTVTVKTGKVYKRKAASIFGITFPVDLFPIPKNCDRKVGEYHYSRGDAYVPITFYTAKFREFEKKKITETPESALKLAEEKLDKKERNTFKNAKILKKKQSFCEKNGEFVLTRSYKCIENIAILENIKINTVKN